MTLTIQPEAPPLRADQSGAVRVGNTRVLLELVLRAYQHGANPEQLVEMYDALSLADVYGVIAYYLRHRDECDRYLAEYDRAGEQIRKQIEVNQRDMSDIRERLLASRVSGSPLK